MQQTHEFPQSKWRSENTSRALEQRCMEQIRRSVWAYWTTVTSPTGSPGPEDGCSSCFQRNSLNSRANLYSSHWFKNGAQRERGGYSVRTSLYKKLMQTICCHTDTLFSIWQKGNQWAVLVSAFPDSSYLNQTADKIYQSFRLSGWNCLAVQFYPSLLQCS